ncbi:50S ribosomal protein L19 [Patescibacteria group bacterium]|nr:50S ribosomal protein L19 [Patescibacteria group bacterium]MBU1256305.1 50S ribosomal protein L19 [Patescibacteria group bacterium]MBU1457675.1 50S ribosomal protein L19 [Patescibacteria group bacterium]
MNRTKWNDQVTFHVGDTIKVHQNIVEGEKKRTQIFSGLVIRIKGHQGLTSFTVRKISSSGVGVERIYPLNAPIILKIEVVKQGKVKRAKLYYLRDRIGKKATKVQDSFVKKQDIEAVEDLKPSTSEVEEKVEKTEPEKKPDVKPLEASNKSELKKEARARRKAKKKQKTERKERKDIR